MAKTQENTAADASTETAAAPAAGGRAIVLTLDDTHASLVGKNSGDTMNRADYIRARADAKVSRGDIKKEISALQGKDVPYQIVFAATKGHPSYAKSAPAADSSSTTVDPQA